MAQRAAVGAPSPVRKAILKALGAKLKGTSISATPKYLASVTDLPVRAVRDELDMMGREQITASRTHRSGEVLYRLRDAVDPRWDAVRGTSLNLN